MYEDIIGIKELIDKVKLLKEEKEKDLQYANYLEGKVKLLTKELIMPELTTKKIAEIRRALGIIKLSAELLEFRIPYAEDAKRPRLIITQVKRIGKLLSDVKDKG